MARIRLQDSGKFASGGTGGFFSLQDDGDIARVRFLYEEEDGSDVDYFLVHRVTIDGKDRYVNCLAVDDEGHINKEDCPLCKNKYKMQEKLFLQLYNVDKGEVQVWERGKNFVKKLMSYINRYKHLCAQEFEIERKGKKGDQGTTYELFNLDKDNITIAEFEHERQELLGSLILDCTPDEMYDIIDGVYVIPGSDENHNNSNNSRRGRDDEPVRRNTRQTSRNTNVDEQPVRRSSRAQEPVEDTPRRRSRDVEPQEEQQPTRRRRVTRE